MNRESEHFMPKTNPALHSWMRGMAKAVALADSLRERFETFVHSTPPYPEKEDEKSSDLLMDIQINGKSVKVRIPIAGDPIIEGEVGFKLIDQAYRDKLDELLNPKKFS